MKQEYEKLIFEAFLKVAPDFAGEKIVEWEPPNEKREFPDIICKCKSGKKVGVELGEWMHQDEIRMAKKLNKSKSQFFVQWVIKARTN